MIGNIGVNRGVYYLSGLGSVRGLQGDINDVVFLADRGSNFLTQQGDGIIYTGKGLHLPDFRQVGDSGKDRGGDQHLALGVQVVFGLGSEVFLFADNTGTTFFHVQPGSTAVDRGSLIQISQPGRQGDCHYRQHQPMTPPDDLKQPFLGQFSGLGDICWRLLFAIEIGAIISVHIFTRLCY